MTTRKALITYVSKGTMSYAEVALPADANVTQVAVVDETVSVSSRAVMLMESERAAIKEADRG